MDAVTLSCSNHTISLLLDLKIHLCFSLLQTSYNTEIIKIYFVEKKKTLHNLTYVVPFIA